MLGNISVYSQVGALVALEHEDGKRSFIWEMKKRRDLAFELFSEIFNVQCPEVQHFYLFADVSSF